MQCLIKRKKFKGPSKHVQSFSRNYYYYYDYFRTVTLSAVRFYKGPSIYKQTDSKNGDIEKWRHKCSLLAEIQSKVKP